MKKIHYFSGLTIALFIFFHLVNHFFSLGGMDQHIQIMDVFRKVYRQILVETILILAVLVQIYSGLNLFLQRRKTVKGFFGKLQLYSGLYLAIFFIIHLSAVFGGRYVLGLDTNVYFGVAGLNTFPFLLFFVPYYGLAIIAFLGHIASIHSVKMSKTIFGIPPRTPSMAIFYFGIVLTLIILYGLTDGFSGVEIPEDYHVLIGK